MLINVFKNKDRRIYTLSLSIVALCSLYIFTTNAYRIIINDPYDMAVKAHIFERYDRYKYYLSKASENGDIGSTYELANFAIDHASFDKDIDPIKLYEKAANDGHMPAKFIMKMFSKYRIDRDNDNARYTFIHMVKAHRGDGSSMLNFAFDFLEGKAVEESKIQGWAWAHLSHVVGYDFAERYCGAIGNSASPDEKKMFESFLSTIITNVNEFRKISPFEAAILKKQ